MLKLLNILGYISILSIFLISISFTSIFPLLLSYLLIQLLNSIFPVKTPSNTILMMMVNTKLSIMGKLTSQEHTLLRMIG